MQVKFTKSKFIEAVDLYVIDDTSIINIIIQENYRRRVSIHLEDVSSFMSIMVYNISRSSYDEVCIIPEYDYDYDILKNTQWSVSTDLNHPSSLFENACQVIGVNINMIPSEDNVIEFTCHGEPSSREALNIEKAKAVVRNIKKD